MPATFELLDENTELALQKVASSGPVSDSVADNFSKIPPRYLKSVDRGKYKISDKGRAYLKGRDFIDRDSPKASYAGTFYADNGEARCLELSAESLSQALEMLEDQYEPMHSDRFEWISVEKIGELNAVNAVKFACGVWGLREPHDVTFGYLEEEAEPNGEQFAVMEVNYDDTYRPAKFPSIVIEGLYIDAQSVVVTDNGFRVNVYEN